MCGKYNVSRKELETYWTILDVDGAHLVLDALHKAEEQAKPRESPIPRHRR